MNIETFTKLMMMTTSPHDGEALNAIRMANAMLNKHKLNWQDVTRTVRIGSPQPKNPKKDPMATWDWGHAWNAWNDATNWEDIQQKMNEAYAAQKRARDNIERTEKIKKMFNYLRKNLEEGDYRKFVSKIHAKWVKSRRLTDREYKGLEKIYRYCATKNSDEA